MSATRMAVATEHAVLKGAPLEPPFPVGLEEAVFGMGCFWGVERKFWKLQGVYTTAVGYAGGTTEHPNYREVCGGRTNHAEVVRVIFDPQKVSYRDLLKTFWENHDPTQGNRQGNDVGTQYRSVIYTYSDEQRARGRRINGRVPGAAEAARLRADHDRDPPGARVLLRRGLSPAVPAQEPQRLLRRWRDGSEVRLETIGNDRERRERSGTTGDGEHGASLSLARRVAAVRTSRALAGRGMIEWRPNQSDAVA